MAHNRVLHVINYNILYAFFGGQIHIEEQRCFTIILLTQRRYDIPRDFQLINCMPAPDIVGVAAIATVQCTCGRIARVRLIVPYFESSLVLITQGY